jgi:Cytochrome oxidase complex assembly protein 1
MTTLPSLPALAFPANPPPTWFSKNGKWFVPVLVLATLVLFAAFVTLIFVAVNAMFRNSSPYQIAIPRATNSSAVAEEIGVPFQAGWLISGSLNYLNQDGNVDMSIPISGAHGRGRIVVSGKKHAGEWTFETFEVDIDGKDPIQLLHPEVESQPTHQSTRLVPLANFLEVVRIRIGGAATQFVARPRLGHG